MISKGKADFIIQDVAGCGLFQVVFVLLINFAARSSVVLSMAFMAFGIYNPGWRCLDYNTTRANTTTRIVSISIFDAKQNISSGYEQKYQSKEFVRNNNCPLFESCQNVQFDPDTSTLISEWGLLCDKAWIPPVIISVQMAGVLVGSVLVGQLGDTIGRKATIYGSHSALAILTTASIFSTSWQIFAVLRFFVGMMCASLLSLYLVFMAEFSTIKWRAGLAGIPAWSLFGVVNGVLTMLLKDWRHILCVTAVVTILGFLPVFWVPESLRWLEVKHKTDRFMKVAKKVTKMNGKTLPSMDVLTSVTNDQPDSRKGTYTILSLFRRGYKMYTVAVGLEWFTGSIWYYVISYGIKSMYGNFYLNLIIMSACDMPLTAFVSSFAPNIFGRKVSCIAAVLVGTLCFFTATGFRLSSSTRLQNLGVTILIFICRITVGPFWCMFSAHTSEVYPTVVRSIGQNWGSLIARIGGIIAPFLIPNDPDTMFISYAILGALGGICCLGIFQLPETKGKPLKETFEDNHIVEI